jgi:KipI family sensor histidine kinase inhibitor
LHLSADDEEPRILPYGDVAALIVLGHRIDPDLNRSVQRLAIRVRELRATDQRWGDAVPAYASLLVRFDGLQLDWSEVKAVLGDLALEAAGTTDPDVDGSELEIPVRYGGTAGPDLAGVADRLGLSSSRVIELHSRQPYQALMLGFSPGFAYLGLLPPELRLPRRDTPRTSVPAGSVAIAGEQTAVYPNATPGGWHLIGRTDLRLWDASRDPPAAIRPGMRVRFRAVG